jgi:hypothetical protein
MRAWRTRVFRRRLVGRRAGGKERLCNCFVVRGFRRDGGRDVRWDVGEFWDWLGKCCDTLGFVWMLSSGGMFAEGH